MRLRSLSIVFVALIIATPLHAAIFLTDASHLEYEINTDTFSTESEASAAATEASYTTPVTVTTTGGGTTMQALGDSFDGYGAIAIDLGGGAFTYTNSGDATLTEDGRNIVFGEKDYEMGSTDGALTVVRKVFVPDDDEFCRWLTIMTNNLEEPLDVTVTNINHFGVHLNDLGSDGLTTVFTTSSGDQIADTSDSWVVTFEDFDEEGANYYDDPRLGHVLQNPGAPVGLATIEFIEGDDEPTWSYDLTIGPGETAIIMNFVTGQPNLPDTVAKSIQLEFLGGSALDFMSEEELSQVVNFDLDAVPATGGGGAVPGHSNPCFIATAAYGTPMADEIRVLRNFRDDVLMATPAGALFVDAYYSMSPPVADFIAAHPAAGALVRVALVPVIFFVSSPWALALFALTLVAAAAVRKRLGLARAQNR